MHRHFTTLKISSYKWLSLVIGLIAELHTALSFCFPKLTSMKNLEVPSDCGRLPISAKSLNLQLQIISVAVFLFLKSNSLSFQVSIRECAFGIEELKDKRKKFKRQTV